MDKNISAKELIDTFKVNIEQKISDCIFSIWWDINGVGNPNIDNEEEFEVVADTDNLKVRVGVVVDTWADAEDYCVEERYVTSYFTSPRENKVEVSLEVEGGDVIGLWDLASMDDVLRIATCLEKEVNK